MTQVIGTKVKIIAFVLLAALAAPARAEDSASSFTDDWLATANEAQAEQPHWMTPLVTVTPRLEQEVRVDFDFARLPGSKGTLDNYGGGKGLEIIPSENTELIIGMPPYQVLQPEGGKPAKAGWGDWPSFLAKYRFLSRNEQHGDEIVTGFFQMLTPTGAQAFTNHFYVMQPTIAGGKGWGRFDIQATLGEQFPVEGNAIDRRHFGDPVLANATLQYQSGVFWPELELNDTYWPNGLHEGKDQLLLTPGVVLGRFEVHNRVKLVFGIGYQIALTPQMPAFRNNIVITTRMAF